MNDRNVVVVLAAAIAVALAAACLVGSIPLGAGRVLAALLGGASAGDRVVVWEIRLPRAVAALVVGAALGASGAALQGLLRNPLAEPGVLGVSATAALGATFVIYYGLVNAGAFALPMAAIAGALAATALLTVAATRVGSVVTLILVGVGLSSFAGAMMALLMNLAPHPFSLSDMLNWMLGTVANRSFDDLLSAAPFLVAGLAILFAGRRSLSALTLGEETAAGSGGRSAPDPAAGGGGRGFGHRRRGVHRRRHRLRRHRRAAPRTPLGQPRSRPDAGAVGLARRVHARRGRPRGTGGAHGYRAQARCRSGADGGAGVRMDCGEEAGVR